MTKPPSTATNSPSKPTIAGGLLSRHSDAHPTDCYVDWVLEHYRALSSPASQPPLIVPLTATFKPGSIRPVEVLLEFERFYARLCHRLVNNYDRPSKRHLLPFAISWRDDPRTRPDKYSARPARHAQFFATRRSRRTSTASWSYTRSSLTAFGRSRDASRPSGRRSRRGSGRLARRSHVSKQIASARPSEWRADITRLGWRRGCRWKPLVAICSAGLATAQN